jgi:hypothetical protein
VFNDANRNMLQDGVNGRREEPEPNIAGVPVTLVDTNGVVYMGVSDNLGNVVFNDVAPGTATVTVQIPDGFEETTPSDNPFMVNVPPSPPVFTVPVVGLIAVEGSAAGKRSQTMTTGAEIAAIAIAGAVLLFMVAVLLRAVMARYPLPRVVTDNYTVVDIHNQRQEEGQAVRTNRRIDYDESPRGNQQRKPLYDRLKRD